MKLKGRYVAQVEIEIEIDMNDFEGVYGVSPQTIKEIWADNGEVIRALLENEFRADNGKVVVTPMYQDMYEVP